MQKEVNELEPKNKSQSKKWWQCVIVCVACSIQNNLSTTVINLETIHKSLSSIINHFRQCIMWTFSEKQLYFKRKLGHTNHQPDLFFGPLEHSKNVEMDIIKNYQHFSLSPTVHSNNNALIKWLCGTKKLELNVLHATHHALVQAWVLKLQSITSTLQKIQETILLKWGNLQNMVALSQHNIYLNHPYLEWTRRKSQIPNCKQQFTILPISKQKKQINSCSHLTN